ncbi:uncharacterized protein LOC134820410 isoform X2 [Bolinopsis microptera]|uniref:uncharacterized protein LOC134820410 isoform X2 n=1 Tax=Bolinopsis microptera TaxID=2820187 RepID=UPI003078C658
MTSLHIIIGLGLLGLCSSEWTPIFNSTSNMVGPFTSSNLPVFKLKFTENKVADQWLYQSVNVNLYDGNGTRLGLTNFIIYATIVDEEVQVTGYKRFYFSGPWSGSRSCSKKLNLDYLKDFNFEMVTSVGSEDMFQFTTSSGERNSESMGVCSSYSTWQDMLLEAESADLGMRSWLSDLPDYFTTEYTVTPDYSTDSQSGTWSKNAGKYLSGYSVGTAKYDSLLKAQSECLIRSDCGGITYETLSKKFTLRRGVNLKDSPSSEISWMAISSEVGSLFPIKENSTSTWNWAHDGITNNGVLELLGDGAVKWNNGDRQGSWGLRDNGTILGTTFNRRYHELRYEDGIATLVIPKRSPPSTMTLISVITGVEVGPKL